LGRERSRSRAREVRELAPSVLETGPPSRLIGGLAIALDAVPRIYEKDVEKGAKIALALILYYDPVTGSWYPARAPGGVPETVVKAYKPDTNTYEYLRLDENFKLYVREAYSEYIASSAVKTVYSYIVNADETAAQSITLDIGDRRTLSVYAKSTAPTTFHLDVSADGNVWFEDAVVWRNTTFASDVVYTAFRYIRLRSDAAGASGDKVTLAVSAKV